MTIREAEKNIIDFYDISNPNDDEIFIWTESLKFMIEKTNESRYMMELGGYYYEIQNFDLALKYYEMAAMKEDVSAYECLGYIWYYGRTGEKDYKKAFEYYEKAMKKGHLVATYKVADMYRNGYYVEKDYDKYKKIIEELYPKVKDLKNVFEPIPEVFTRLAKIRMVENKNGEAKNLLLKAKDVLAERISINAFFGNFTIMKWLIKDLYKVKEFDANDFDLYDLYYVLEKPTLLTFENYEERYEVESVIEDGELVVRFKDKWFRTIDDFMQKAEIDGKSLCKIYFELENFKIQN